MAPTVSIHDIPELPGYVTVAAAAERLKLRKTTVFRMVYEQGFFPGAMKVTWGEGKDQQIRKHLLLLPRHEVEKLIAQRKAASAAPPDHRRLLLEWNRRVKKWGLAEGWIHAPIHKSGAPHAKLAEDYLKANPGDPRPTLDIPTADALMAG